MTCLASLIRAIALALLLTPIGVMTAWAGSADVVRVEVRRQAPGVYDFDVTVKSDDTGWAHYADAFEVLGPDGKVLGRRVLLHPHEDEQPFTRDLHGVRVPAGITRVTVRAHHKVKGYDGAVVTVALPR